MAIERPPCRNGTWYTPGNASSDEEIQSDTSSELVEIQSDEFPRYFVERNGRLFHSHGPSPYPLPVDADEQHRQNRQHVLLYSLIGAHYVGPVQDVLRPIRGVQRQAVDLGTGTGKWVMDMADRFSHVRFSGIDIVPIQTRHPLPNVWFEMHDLAEPLGWRLLSEVARALRPGGLYISGEWYGYPTMEDESCLSERAPRTCRFFDLVNHYLRQNGIGFVAANVPEWVRRTDAFFNVQVEDLYVPIGAGNPGVYHAGERLKTNLRVFAASMQLWLVERGYCSRMAAQDLTNGFLLELDTIQGMELKYRIVCAQRK
ncbi:hypothetical protein EVJ58_g879 [Rhodofomes roseus]|uniref:S-adenosyl-L-methionine-dependent methyltransferase n=1 Tax=Rhodofomes roseus TaxID=34475 RepID=A0A4Y9Z1F5_9APHY|nr:hypothetical protein EVJ58_g879 [Rhodofomes roseus]